MLNVLAEKHHNTDKCRTFQSSVLGKLLDWGAASLEKSLNQPSLPHAVIVLNATDMGIQKEEWDPEVATERLLDAIDADFDKNPDLHKYLDQWLVDRGIKIRSIRELLNKYYSSFTVVRMPVKGRYTLMDEQARHLHRTIERRCMDSFASKSRARMVSNAEDLNIYLQAAFDHFTNGLDRPFNFIDVSLKNNPLPETFADHILQLALAIHAQYRDQYKTTGQWIFEHVGRIAASCIMIDCIRYRKGPIEDLFESYRDFLELALDDFCDIHWQCSYRSPSGKRCVSVRARHDAKDHQNESGKIIGGGGYQSMFSADAYRDEWIQSVRNDLVALYQELRNVEQTGRQMTPLQYALQMHRERLTTVLKAMHKTKGKHLVSHATCFCCLREIPEHCLPCGHVLCSSCVRAYAKTSSSTVRVMENCPLHHHAQFVEPWRIWFKPEYAGVRALSLDGYVVTIMCSR